MSAIDKTYKLFLLDVKKQISESQQQAITAINHNLILLYWKIGTGILQRQQQLGWGAGVINKLSSDIQKSFPDLKGFSYRNLNYMRAFAEAYPVEQFVQVPAETLVNRPVIAKKPIVQALPAQLKNKASKSKNLIVQALPAQLEVQFMQAPLAQLPLAQISWTHHVLLLSRNLNSIERNWYITQTLENGWSSRILLHQLDTDLYKRQAKKKKTHNFNTTLPPAQSDLALQMLKDPYIFDFITVSEKANERNIEDQLCEHVTKFLLELGQGFAFIGRQYRLPVTGKKEYSVDLLFYNIKLRCYVVVELKARDFEPEDAGKLNFYLNVINAKLRSKDENPTIGLLLCKGKNEVLADYSLAGINQPIGVADYKLTKAIPKKLKSTLPSIADLERELKEIE
ncbi:MAG: PDDEXK nuclease domain-containing protein [Bacteroidia bacterium]